MTQPEVILGQCDPRAWYLSPFPSPLLPSAPSETLFLYISGGELPCCWPGTGPTTVVTPLQVSLTDKASHLYSVSSVDLVPAACSSALCSVPGKLPRLTCPVRPQLQPAALGSRSACCPTACIFFAPSPRSAQWSGLLWHCELCGCLPSCLVNPSEHPQCPVDIQPVNQSIHF